MYIANATYTKLRAVAALTVVFAVISSAVAQPITLGTPSPPRYSPFRTLYFNGYSEDHPHVGLHADNDLLFLQQHATIHIFDISADPLHPELLTIFDPELRATNDTALLTSPMTFVRRDSILFVSIDFNLTAIDIGDPSNPAVLDSIQIFPADYSIEMLIEHEGIVYLTSVPARGKPGRLVEVDISDPGALEIIREREIPHTGSLFVRDGYLVGVGNGTVRVYLLDESGSGNLINSFNLHSPTDHNSFGRYIYDSALIGDVLVVSSSYDGQGGIWRVGFETPALPNADIRHAANVAVGNNRFRIEGAGDRVIAWDSNHGTRVLQLDNDGDLVQTAQYGYFLTSMEPHGNILYATAARGLYVLDSANLPDTLGEPYYATLRTPNGWVKDAAMGTTSLFILDDEAIISYDVMDADNPVRLNRIAAPTVQSGFILRRTMVWDNHRLFMSSALGGLDVYDVRDPAGMTFVGALLDGTARPPYTVLNNVLYILSGPLSQPRIDIVDVADPLNPQLLGNIFVTANGEAARVHNILLRDGRLYATVRTNYIVVWDVNDPTQPAWLGEFDLEYPFSPQANIIRDAGPYLYTVPTDSMTRWQFSEDEILIREATWPLEGATVGYNHYIFPVGDTIFAANSSRHALEGVFLHGAQGELASPAPQADYGFDDDFPLFPFGAITFSLDNGFAVLELKSSERPDVVLAPSAFAVDARAQRIAAAVSNRNAGPFRWQAHSNAPEWLTVWGHRSGESGQNIDLAVAANTTGSPRSGDILLHVPGSLNTPLTLTIMQKSLRDSELSLSVTEAELPAGGGEFEINVANLGDKSMAWSASELSPWLDIASGGSGIDAGIITIQAGENDTGQARSAILTVSAPGSINQVEEVLVRQPALAPREDVNDSGDVNAIDVQLVINAILAGVYEFRFDINVDDMVDAVDLQRVINAALQ